MKKIALILAMFLFISTSYGKERIEDMSKLEARDGIIYVRGEDKPYTGTFTEKHELNGLYIITEKYEEAPINRIKEKDRKK